MSLSPRKMIPHDPNAVLQFAWTYVVQVSVLIAGIGLFTRAFCRRSPHLAHVLWLVVVIKCLIPPVLSSPTSVFNDWNFVLPATESNDALGETIANKNPTAPVAATFSDECHVVDVAAGSESITHISETLTARSIIAVWAFGAAVVALRIVWLWTTFYRMVSNCGDSDNDEVNQLLSKLACHLGFRSRPRLVITRQGIGPVVFGLSRPTIAIPESLVRDAKGEHLEPTLAHELVHLRRRDLWWGTLQLLTQIVWWFHPLVWWANREAGRERERCCDEEVVSSMGYRPAQYIRCLINAMESGHKPLRGPLFAAIRPVDVASQRIRIIMTHAESFRQRTPRWCWAVACVAFLLVLPGGTQSAQRTSPLPSVDELNRVIAVPESPNKRVVEHIQEMGGRVEIDESVQGAPIVSVGLAGPGITVKELEILHGQDRITRLSLYKTRIGDDGLALVARLRNLRWLNLSNSEFSNAGIARIAESSSIEDLILYSTSVTDAGLRTLTRCPNLKSLNLRNTNVSNVGLIQLSDIQTLEELSLSFIPAISTLKNLASLKRLQLSDVTNDEITIVQRRLPDVEVVLIRPKGKR